MLNIINMVRDLEKIIKDLINSRREGIYWDFKEKYPINKISLLHDILCLANCKYDGDRYLIFGVKDPNNTSIEDELIVGLSEKEFDKFKSNNIHDWIEKIPFINEKSPIIDISKIKINNKNIGVIIIRNSPDKPFYLTEDYGVNESFNYSQEIKKVYNMVEMDAKKEKILKEIKRIEENMERYIRCYYIYSREGDKNTSIDTSSNYTDIKEMWKEKFGLTIKENILFKRVLKRPNDWIFSEDEESDQITYFNKYHPEYSIEQEITSHKNKNNKEYKSKFAAFYHRLDVENINFKYFNRVIYTINMIYTNMYISCFPEPDYIDITENIGFYYYDLTEINGLFFNILKYDKENVIKNIKFPYIEVKNKFELNNMKSKAHQFLKLDEEKQKKYLNSKYQVENNEDYNLNELNILISLTEFLKKRL